METQVVGAVSVQRGTAADPVEGHLAWAVALDVDVVVAHGPLDWLHGGERLEVLAAAGDEPGPGGAAGPPVQRLTVRGAHELGLADDPGGAVAVLRLTGPLYRGGAGRCFEPAVLDEALAAGTDVWAALEDAGVVPAGLRGQPHAELLARVGELESVQRLAMVRTTLLPTFPPGWINPFCLLSPKCGCG
ncbi:hypothetical protein [Kineococcus sp. NUM-3379]